MVSTALINELVANPDLKRRLRDILPREIWPDKDTFILSADRDLIQQEIKRSRKDENAWPRLQYLWPLNPVVEWVNDQVTAAFGRHEAPGNQSQGGQSQAADLIHSRSGCCSLNEAFIAFTST